MAVATHTKHTTPTDPTLSESPIDWRMDIGLHEVGDDGYSSDGFGSQDSIGHSRLRLIQPCDKTVDSATTVPLVRELQQRINELTARIDCLEDRLPSPHHAVPAFDTDAEPVLSQDESDDPVEVADPEPEQIWREDGAPNLADLPRGPLSIDVVATALGKTVRTLRGWCQIEKYEIPAHKEAGHWRFYKDELVAWYGDYERISRRDAKHAQAKRRKTKHGKQRL